MNLRRAICRLSALLILTSLAFGQSVDKSAEALKVIGDFADRLCQTVPLETQTETLQLSGDAKAELEGIIKKLASLGISGAAKYESSSSKNVLQKDLAEVLKDARNCRLQIWNDLKGKFQIGSPRSEELQKIASALLATNKLTESLQQDLEQVKELVTSGLRRAQEAEEKGRVPGLIKELQQSGDSKRLLEFLVEERNKHKNDLLERNREIAVVAYLRHDMRAAAAAVDEILRLQPDDLDALIVKANIVWLTRGGAAMEGLFNQILEVATKKHDLEAQAGALANLGEFYWGGSGPLPPKSMEMFTRARELERRLADERGVPFYDPLPDHTPPLVKGNLLEYERFYHEWGDGRRRGDKPERVAEAHGYIGVVRLKNNDLDGAEKWMLKALRLYQEISPESAQSTVGEANQYANLGIVFALRRDTARAKESWLRARGVYARADARIAFRIDTWIQNLEKSR